MRVLLLTLLSLAILAACVSEERQREQDLARTAECERTGDYGPCDASYLRSLRKAAAKRTRESCTSGTGRVLQCEGRFETSYCTCRRRTDLSTMTGR